MNRACAVQETDEVGGVSIVSKASRSLASSRRTTSQKRGGLARSARSRRLSG